MRNVERAYIAAEFSYGTATSKAQFSRLIFLLYAVEGKCWRLARQAVGASKKISIVMGHVAQGAAVGVVSANEPQRIRNVVIR